MSQALDSTRRSPKAKYAAILFASLALSSCSPYGQAPTWDGRRGYDGAGDYGYDLQAPREAEAFEARAKPDYPVPGTADDPWGPYVREAAGRFGMPETWIRAVMRQESGGREFAGDGTPTTSVAGAMGLMQVMPGTYDLMRRRYGLGPDAYDPHDNVLAGAAYLKEMHVRFGAPGFLAAYNAGPDRVDDYLRGGAELPVETINYVAAIGPRLGMAGAVPGPSGGDSFNLASRPTPDDPADAAFGGGGMTGAEYDASRR